MQELNLDPDRISKRPSLAKHARLQIDRLTGEPVLLSQEAVFTLNGSAYEVLKRCDGTRSFTQLVEELAERYPSATIALWSDALRYLEKLSQKGLVQWI
jgi:pyrroloquinoline quinone biosynthesis protein D